MYLICLTSTRMRAVALILGCLLLLTSPGAAQAERFYLGTYTDKSGSQGIYLGALDAKAGRLGPLKLAALVKPDPTFLVISPDENFLFAALSNAVASFRIQPDGTLVEINRQPSGADTCHVSLDRTGRELFAASYGEGSISAYPIGSDGQIGLRTAYITLHGSGPNRSRQEGPHAHSVYVDPENHFLYACDLGSDRIWIFRVRDNGGLTPSDPPSVAVTPGSGPRHLAFQGKFVFVINELSATTAVYKRNSSTGALNLLQTEANIDPGWSKGTGSAEVEIHPTGHWLYASTRLTDRLTVFAIDATSSREPLRREQVLPCPVKFPRSFAIDPSGRWLIAAGQTDNAISVLRVAQGTGRLTVTDQRAQVGSPVCVLFLPFKY